MQLYLFNMYIFASDDQFDNKKKENIAAYFFEKTSCSAVREAERTHEPQINFYLTGFQLI